MNFDVLVAAAREALGTVKSVKSISEPDEDLKRYMQLRPHNFINLIDKMGEEATLDYIRTMEKRLADHKAGK